MTENLYNLEAEQSVLGAILFDPDSLLRAADIVETIDFYDEKHRRIYDAMLDAYQTEELNIIYLCERLKIKGELEKIGGISYLSKLANFVPTAANVSYHARLIREKAILRRIKAWAYETGNKAGNGIGDLREFFGQMEQDVIDLSQSIREKRNPLISNILAEIRQDWQREKEGIKTHIKTDFKLQSVIPGFYPGHLLIIGGYTSVGKSTFLAQVIIDACEEGAKCLIFSTEDKRQDKAIKLIANLADVTQRRLILGAIEGFEDRVRLAENQLEKWGLIIYDDIYSVDELRLKVKKHKMQQGVDIVCLDFIQNLQGPGSIYERMSEAIIKLQAMAKELEVTVIALSQVSNEAMRQDTEIIGLKGAGELAAAADIVLWLKRHKEKGHEQWLDCEVRKNRPFGTTGIIPFKFSNFWTRIERRA